MQTNRLASAPYKALLMLTLAPLLAGCGAGAPASVKSLRGAIDASATTACGKTPADQLKIDRTTESGFRAGVWDRPQTVRC